MKPGFNMSVKYPKKIEEPSNPEQKDIFQIMQDEREQVLNETETLNKTLIETLYENLRLPIGLVCFILGGMQNQLYAWSHDFASQEYVGVPVTNKFMGFTGAEWEFFNIFFAQGSAILLALIGGYFIGEAIWKRDAEIHLDNKKLESIRNMKGLGKEAKKEIDGYLMAKRKWIPNLEHALKEKHPKLYHINGFLKSRGGLPITILAHTLVLSAVHYTWSQRYFEGKTYVAGVVHESVFWNWSWFLGAYTTYTALCLSAYYFFYTRMKRKPARMADKIGRRINKLQARFEKIRVKREKKASKKMQAKYLATVDRIIKLEKELTFWKALE